MDGGGGRPNGTNGHLGLLIKFVSLLKRAERLGGKYLKN